MGLSKTERFNEKQNNLALLAKAMGHPARIAILEHLIASDACVCGDIVDELGLAQATVSQHLKELKNMGFIKGNVEGTSVCYCIDEEKWGEVKELFADFFSMKALALDCC